MPSDVSRGEEERADIQTSNLGARLDHDASGSNTAAGGHPKTAKTSSQMASATNKTPPGAELDDSLDGTDKADSKSHNAVRTNKPNSNSRDDSLQVPDSGNNNNSNRRPIETSIWDWDTPLDSVGESTSYYYEPQGELLQEQREHRPSRSEFSIPTVVPGSGLNWPFPNGSIGSQDFAVPRRPTGHPPASLLGVKRKSTSEQSLNVPSRADKRMSRTTMSDSGDDEASPIDPRPPVHNTRSQSGPGTRVRGSTDTSESRPRPQTIDIEGLRPPYGGAIPGTGPRRMTDPGVPMVLPARKVFPIQIGDKLFRLSGASISSDGQYYDVSERDGQYTNTTKPPRTFRNSLKSSYGRVKVQIVSEHSTSTGIRRHSKTSHYTYRVITSSPRMDRTL